MSLSGKNWSSICTTLLKSSADKIDFKERFVAHRGANNDAPGNTLPHLPENTIHSLREAYAVGAQYVECDIHKTADGQLIVLHDDTLERTARFNPKLATTLSQNHFLSIQKSKVNTLDYRSEVSQVDVGCYESFLDEKYRGTTISLLEKFLVELQNFPQRKLVIELKAGDVTIVKELGKLIKRCVTEFKLQTNQLVFISFDFNLIKHSKENLPGFKHFMLTTSKPSDDDVRPDPDAPGKQIGIYYRINNKDDLNNYIKIAKHANLDGIDAEYDAHLMDEDFVQRIHDGGLLSAIWTYHEDDTLEMAKHMLAIGADLINTNQPERIFAELNKDIQANQSKKLC